MNVNSPKIVFFNDHHIHLGNNLQKPFLPNFLGKQVFPVLTAGHDVPLALLFGAHKVLFIYTRL